MPKILITVIGLMLIGSFLFAQAPNISDSYVQESRANFQSALDVMLELSSKDPADSFYKVRIAWLQYLMGKYQEAILTYRAAIALQDNLDAQTGIINCLLALGQYSEAITAVDAQLIVHKQNPTLMSKAAYAAYMSKNYALAASYYQRMLSIYPWDMESRGYLVNNLYLAGNVEEARLQYQSLLKYYPQSTIITQYKGVLDK
ncbi:MAG TPA: tetratricopeptide repeat protein [Candidatus Cloacimonadota bacterium]|nr:tetratricopeptide repeat protein [Candidatus Cloacimonadota bacterium]